MIDLKQLTDAELEQLTDEQIEQMDDVQITQLACRLAKLSHELKASRAHYKLWMGLRETQDVIVSKHLLETLTDRENWLMYYCYNNVIHPKPETSHEECAEVYMLLKQPFSQVRGRLNELMFSRYWPIERSLLLYDLQNRTFPVCRQDGELVSQIMQAQHERYEEFILPAKGLPSQWDEEDFFYNEDDRPIWQKLYWKLRWHYHTLTQPFRKRWPPKGIEQLLSGSIYEQSPDALIQLRFSWQIGVGGLPTLVFVPMKQLEHFRFGINDEFECYSSYHPSTGGGYPWCELIPILENVTGNDDDWRFKDGCVFEYCLKGE